MPMTERENKLRAIRFQGPEHIPVKFGCAGSAWPVYREDLEDLLLRHPVLFPGFEKGRTDFDNQARKPNQRVGKPWRDPWGCLWKTAHEGMTGVVIEHPLADWSAFDDFRPPDPEKTNGMVAIDWAASERRIRGCKERGELAQTGLPHSFLYLRLTFLRGFENLVYDMAEERPELSRLIAMIEDFSATLVRRYAGFEPDMMSFGEDLGTQTAPLLSPEQFRTYIKPSYKRLMSIAKGAGAAVNLHSDGYLWPLMDDILDCGVDSLNIQDLVHGVDNLARELKGRVCLNLDVDRQKVTVFGSPGDVDDLIREEVTKLDSPEGGLCLGYGLYPGTPLENAEAVMTAFEKYALGMS